MTSGRPSSITPSDPNNNDLAKFRALSGRKQLKQILIYLLCTPALACVGLALYWSAFQILSYSSAHQEATAWGNVLAIGPFVLFPVVAFAGAAALGIAFACLAGVFVLGTVATVDAVFGRARGQRKVV